MRFEDLYYISNELNKENIKWVIGSSVLLYFHGIVEKPNDIDIVIHEKDIVKTKSIFDRIGTNQVREKKELFSTEFFYTYIVRDSSVDVMCNFGIRHEVGDYKFIIDEEAIVEYRKVQDTLIPLSSLEDWYVLYQLIPGREAKVKMIEDYLSKNGVQNINILKRSKSQPLPKDIVGNVNKIIK